MSEREQIVAWLRGQSDKICAVLSNPAIESKDYFRGQVFAYDRAADAIERGDDLKEQP